MFFFFSGSVNKNKNRQNYIQFFLCAAGIEGNFSLYKVTANSEMIFSFIDSRLELNFTQQLEVGQ